MTASSHPHSSPQAAHGATTAWFVISLVLIAGLALLAQRAPLFFNVVADSSRIAVGTTIFLVAWGSRHSLEPASVLLLGIGLFYAACFDALHLACLPSMDLVPIDDARAMAKQAWNCARLLEGLGLALATWTIGRQYPAGRSLAAGLLIALILLGAISLPLLTQATNRAPYRDGELADQLVHAVIFLLILAAIHGLRRHQGLPPASRQWLLAGLSASALAEAAPSLFPHPLLAFEEPIDHGLKLIAYLFFFKGIIISALREPYSLLFRKLRTNEEALRESNDRLHLLLNSTGEGIYGLDMAGAVTFCNRSCLTLLGFTEPEQLLGKDMHSLIHHHRADGSLYPMRECRIYQAFQDGNGVDVEDEVFFRADGSSFPVEYQSYPIRQAGILQGAVVSFTDTTERRRKREELHRANTLKETILNAIDHQIALLDASTMEILEANASCLEFHGREIIGRPCHQVLHRHLATPCGEFPCPLRTTLRTGAATVAEHSHETKDGRPYTAEIATYPIKDEAGRVVQVVHVERDITAHKEMLARLEEAKEAAEAGNRAKSEFLAIVSHEFRTPMNAIIGMNYLLANSELPPRQQEYCRELDQAVRNLEEKLNTVLSFSRATDHDQEEETPFTLADLLAEVMDLEGTKAAGKPLTLATDVAAEVPNRLRGLPRLIVWVLRHLLDNAIKFSDRGAIVVTVQAVARQGQRLSLRFSVADHGIGMDSPRQKGLFQAFSLADSSTSRPHGGLGLGLAACQRVVERMGGTMAVESQLGSGSTFSFTVDLLVVDETGPQAEAGLPPPPVDAVATPVAPGEVLTPTDLSRLRTRLEAMAALAVVNDMAAERVFSEIRPHLQLLCPTATLELAAALDRFDFTTISLGVRQLLTTLGQQQR